MVPFFFVLYEIALYFPPSHPSTYAGTPHGGEMTKLPQLFPRQGFLILTLHSVMLWGKGNKCTGMVVGADVLDSLHFAVHTNN